MTGFPYQKASPFDTFQNDILLSNTHIGHSLHFGVSVSRDERPHVRRWSTLTPRWVDYVTTHRTVGSGTHMQTFVSKGVDFCSCGQKVLMDGAGTGTSHLDGAGLLCRAPAWCICRERNAKKKTRIINPSSFLSQYHTGNGRGGGSSYSCSPSQG